ncbi:hypothetical protein Nmel_005321 [Mimus melanotis]
MQECIEREPSCSTEQQPIAAIREQREIQRSPEAGDGSEGRCGPGGLRRRGPQEAGPSGGGARPPAAPPLVAAVISGSFDQSDGRDRPGWLEWQLSRPIGKAAMLCAFPRAEGKVAAAARWRWRARG